MPPPENPAADRKFVGERRGFKRGKYSNLWMGDVSWRRYHVFHSRLSIGRLDDISHASFETPASQKADDGSASES